jgi:hypothetical protein
VTFEVRVTKLTILFKLTQLLNRYAVLVSAEFNILTCCKFLKLISAEDAILSVVNEGPEITKSTKPLVIVIIPVKEVCALFRFIDVKLLPACGVIVIIACFHPSDVT